MFWRLFSILLTSNLSLNLLLQWKFDLPWIWWKIFIIWVLLIQYWKTENVDNFDITTHVLWFWIVDKILKLRQNLKNWIFDTYWNSFVTLHVWRMYIDYRHMRYYTKQLILNGKGGGCNWTLSSLSSPGYGPGTITFLVNSALAYGIGFLMKNPYFFD